MYPVQDHIHVLRCLNCNRCGHPKRMCKAETPSCGVWAEIEPGSTAWKADVFWCALHYYLDFANKYFVFILNLIFMIST